MISPLEIDNRCLGKTFEEAKTELAKIGYIVRNTSNGTDDVKLNRVNLFLENGVVAKWHIG